MRHLKDSDSYTIEIYRGLFSTFWYRHALREKGFSFKKMAYGRSYYHKATKSREECEEMVTYCRYRGLNCCIYEKEYTRSNDYRKVFFENQNYQREYTLCAYCGLPLKVSKISVDHIIPVHKAKNTKEGRLLMKIFGIRNINEVRNLCASCVRCNSKKGKKTGLWVIRGFIGRIIPLWYVRWGIRGVLLIAILTAYLNLF